MKKAPPPRNGSGNKFDNQKSKDSTSAKNNSSAAILTGAMKYGAAGMSGDHEAASNAGVDVANAGSGGADGDANSGVDGGGCCETAVKRNEVSSRDVKR